MTPFNDDEMVLPRRRRIIAVDVQKDSCVTAVFSQKNLTKEFSMTNDDKHQVVRMLPIAIERFMLSESDRKRIPSAKKLKKFARRYVDAVLFGARRIKAG